MYPTHEFDSAQPAGTTIYEDQDRGAESSEKRSKLWFDGRDADLFNVVTGDLVPVALRIHIHPDRGLCASDSRRRIPGQ